MLDDVFWACAFVLAGILILRFGPPLVRRFDEKNTALMEQQERDKSDPNAHFRHALDVANEQVEDVQEVKAGAATHYLFETQAFASRDEAEEMRARRVGVIARRFYEELPVALASRSEPRSKLSARERAAQRWKKTMH